MITATKFVFLPQRSTIIFTKPGERITSEAHLTVYPPISVLTTTSKDAKNMSFRLRNSNSQTAPLDSSNLPLWTASEIAEAINGTIIKPGPPGTISTDTRTIQPGQWFFAIAGKNFDAHDFITPELQEKGCLGVIGNRVCKNWEKGFVKVEGNTLNSLKKLAIYARNRFCGCLIGLTGSVGKTTTRTMIALALESIGEVYQSHGNWNNEIGVPLSLIGIPRNADFVVLELGMCEKGDILELASLCRPSIRVILNVGASHLENFGSLEEASMAKEEILREAKAGDICVLNADDPLVMSLPVPLGVKKVCGALLLSLVMIMLNFTGNQFFSKTLNLAKCRFFMLVFVLD